MHSSSFFPVAFLSSDLIFFSLVPQTPIPTGVLWKRFLQLKPRFVETYVAYHHFRSCGWVPKSGLKFGVDFLLYREGPESFHSAHSVLVNMVDEETKLSASSSTRTMTWASLTNLGRLGSQVAKELMQVYVVRPSTMQAGEMESADCLPLFKVQETLLRRWVPERDRDDKSIED
eukprot:m.394124 g.394124  ORF g.394124 m.394124 type:complete len:174 (+) comp56369_c0_seq15:1202-1723(+)